LAVRDAGAEFILESWVAMHLKRSEALLRRNYGDVLLMYLLRIRHHLQNFFRENENNVSSFKALLKSYPLRLDAVKKPKGGHAKY